MSLCRRLKPEHLLTVKLRPDYAVLEAPTGHGVRFQVERDVGEFFDYIIKQRAATLNAMTKAFKKHGWNHPKATFDKSGSDLCSEDNRPVIYLFHHIIIRTARIFSLHEYRGSRGQKVTFPRGELGGDAEIVLQTWLDNGHVGTYPAIVINTKGYKRRNDVTPLAGGSNRPSKFVVGSSEPGLSTDVIEGEFSACRSPNHKY